MKNNKLIISAAGSGKTTYLINEALKRTSEKVLITTYTEANEAEIRKKILQKRKSIPSNIKVQTWFSFLLQHGVRPYQGAMNDILWEKEIKGMLLSEGESGIKKSFKNKYGKKINITYKEEEEFDKHYFTKNWKIYSDKISKFIFKCNKKTNNKVIARLTEIYPSIFIDEVQDLAGYDLELIKSLFQSSSEILLVGDPRQVTYLTHHSRMNKKYKNGKIKEYLQDKCKSLLSEYSIDETILKKSHRNNKEICDFSSKLFPEYEKSEPCICESCRNYKKKHEGVFIIKPKDVNEYLKKYKPVQLRWDKKTKTNPDYFTYNFGESKGQTHDRVIIYPTKDMKKWLKDNNYKLTDSTKSKLYVAITRARYSVAIICDYKNDESFPDAIKYK
jgi:DNA helicase-2/ATP-dependent DNA helicase PcrA